MHPLSMLAMAIGLTIVLVSTPAHAASLLIELKNGREVSTSHVWEEGDEIKFYTPYGTAGVSKHHVKRIKAATTVSHDKGSKTSLPPSPMAPEVATTDTRSKKDPQQDGDSRREEGKGQPSSDTQQDGGVGLTAGEAQAYHAKKVMLTAELDHATQKYLEASGARNRDAILDLGDEVKKKNGGVLPPWWND
jgi:hypothetical protein